MPTDPVAAGRKGGSRNTPAQQAARRANGFQKVERPKETTAPVKRDSQASPAQK